MVRLTYLIPRFVIIALIMLAVWVGSDPLIRRALTDKIQSTTGAKAEIGGVRYALSKHKVFLKEVTIADSRSPMRNLIQAEMIYAELNPANLLQRQIVIENGQTTQLVFGAPRTASGSLGLTSQPDTPQKSWEPKQFATVQEVGLAWLDSLPIASDSVSNPNYELFQATEGLAEFWSTEMATQSKTISQLAESKANLKSLQQSVNSNNVLRVEQVSTATELSALVAKTKATENRLVELQRLALTQREALTNAHRRDLQKIRQTTQTASFESDAIAKLLLSEFEQDRVAEALGWFHWFRSSLPDPKEDFTPKNQRGVDVLFPGLSPKPNFLIQAIELEGEGRFANQHISFAGTAKNLTTEPEHHSQPASFEIRAQGDQHMIIACTLDRRNAVPVDTLSVVCPDLELPEQLLGEASSMLVTMGPASHIQADIKLKASGNNVSGELVFRHSNVSLHVDKLNEMVGGEETALQLNHGLASVDRFETRVALSGSFDDYDFQFQSDLGSRFVQAANQLLLERAEQTIATKQKQLDTFLMRQQTAYDEIGVEIEKMQRVLQSEQIEIANLRQSTTQPTDRWGKLR